MRYLSLIFAFLTLTAHAEDANDDPAATAIEISGEVTTGDSKAVELGQTFNEGDRLITKADSSLHLVLADGSSLVLGASTELTLSKLQPKTSVFDLLKGAVNAMVEKLTTGAVFEVDTVHTVAAVKGTDFEVSADADESSVTVNQGEVSMMDPDRKRIEAVPALHRGLARRGILNKAFRLSKREAGEFQNRWARARMIHGQRKDLMRHFREERRARRKKLGAGADKDDLKERRKKARDRFKKAREELKKEREEKE